ncbi:MAG: CoA ester lyase [Gammaproteobacteria bacterium]|nr:CoA ester lyase [Gammaproteobacteria bacterium]
MRSMLFVPGDRPERFAKAVASGADAVIFDLEDAVVPERRPQARVEIARYLGEAERRVPLWVRINPVATDEALPDLVAVIDGRPDGIMLPKARDGEDVHRASHWIESLEAHCGLAAGSVGLIPLVTESAGAVLNAASFAKLPERVRGLTWGAEDLAADVGALGNRTPEGEYEFTYAYARSMCLLAAAAAGVAAIDTVDTEIRDTPAIERRARESRRQGFVGKMAIHPSQVAPIHAAFSPSAAEVEWAGRVLAAFRESPGKGALSLDGRMLDKPHIRQAERILAAASRR